MRKHRTNFKRDMATYLLAIISPLIAIGLGRSFSNWFGDSSTYVWHLLALIVIVWQARLGACILSIGWSIVLVHVFIFSKTGNSSFEASEVYRSAMFAVIGMCVTALGHRSRIAAQVAKRAEQTSAHHLKQSREREARHTTILDNVGDYAILMISPEGNVVSWNHGAEKIKGYKAEEIVGKPFWHLLGGDEASRQKADMLLAHAKEQGRWIGQEIRQRKNGTTFVGDFVLSAVWDNESEDGERKKRLIGYVEIVNDVTDQLRREEDLNYQLHLNETITKSAVDPMFMLDHLGRITFFNPAAEKLFGYTEKELLGKVLHSVLHYKRDDGSDFPIEECPLAKVLKTGVEERDYETKFVHRDGHFVHVSTSHAAVFNEKRVTGSVLVVHDLTERVKHQLAIADSERFARATVDALSAHIVILNQEGVIVAENKAWKDFCGTGKATNAKPNQYLGQNYIEVCERAEGLDAEHGHAAAEGIKSVLSGETESFSMEYPCHSCDERAWFMLRVTRFQGAGPVRVVVAHENITQQKETAQHLLESESRYRAMFEESAVGLAEVTLDGYFQAVNNTYTEITGYFAEELVGRTVESITHPEDVGADAIAREQAKAGKTVRREKRYIRKDGSTVWIIVATTCVHNVNGQPDRLIVSINDISTRKQFEADLMKAKELAEAASKAKDTFIAVLSHELRTPLTPVLASIDGLIRFNRIPEHLKDEVWMLRRNVELEISLIDDLLDVTRIARGKLTLNHQQDVYTHDLVRNVLRVCEDDIKSRQITVKTEFNARNCHVCGDPARLQQVLWNLVKNSIKFTSVQGKITIRTENDGDDLRISVQDNGNGIERQHLPNLFSPFEQGDHAAGSMSKGGLGLGLSIAKGLVEMHGGKIEAYSEGRYRGATFSVTLPTIEPERAKSVKPEEPAPRAAPQQGARILLVEDHEDTRSMMAKLLTYSGYEVDTAETVADAFKKVTTHKYDLLVSDIGLPDGTGHDLMRRIRGSNIVLRGIALTGFGQDDDMKRSREVGFKSHVTKPVNLDVLTNAINQTLTEAI